jgi:mono/diheme cytochrome c family protein
MSEKYTDNRLIIGITGVTIGLAVLLVLVITYQFGYDSGARSVPATKSAAASTQKTTTQTSATTGPGKQLFTSTCASCHTLAAAGTKGTVGPNLDTLKPDATRVLNALKIGGRGTGMMPKNLYQGQQAQQVADFVSAAAGK